MRQLKENPNQRCRRMLKAERCGEQASKIQLAIYAAHVLSALAESNHSYHALYRGFSLTRQLLLPAEEVAALQIAPAGAVGHLVVRLEDSLRPYVPTQSACAAVTGMNPEPRPIA
jgi:hypothetical protein